MTADGERLAIILFAHGSVVEEANQGVHDLASQIRGLGRFHFVRAAFLDCAHPNLGEAIEEASNARSTRVIVIPYFLTMGIHLRRDLPNLVAPEREKHPKLVIGVAQSLEGHPLMTSIVLERVEQALQEGEADA
ncbi:MAG: CbiX/SirB N-terminal domain-containing protein [Acidobacteria bacterium]|nr:CbiX/SirB N-terminal domain-containing protein [Acidobacteriota bacterium]